MLDAVTLFLIILEYSSASLSSAYVVSRPSPSCMAVTTRFGSRTARSPPRSGMPSNVHVLSYPEKSATKVSPPQDVPSSPYPVPSQVRNTDRSSISRSIISEAACA